MENNNSHTNTTGLLFEKEPYSNSRLARILGAAVKRAYEATLFFARQKAACHGIFNKAFFLYADVKKDAQRALIEKVSRSLGIELSPSLYSPPEGLYVKLPDELGDDFEKLYAIIFEKAIDEVEFYNNYAHIETNNRTRSVLLMLADLSQEFLFDIKIWYINHKMANRAISFDLNDNSLVVDFAPEPVSFSQ